MAAEWRCEERPYSKNESFRDDENVPETGCLSIIVLGASGDLAKKKTFPALYNLYHQVDSDTGSESTSPFFFFTFCDSLLGFIMKYAMICKCLCSGVM